MRCSRPSSFHWHTDLTGIQFGTQWTHHDRVISLKDICLMWFIKFQSPWYNFVCEILLVNFNKNSNSCFCDGFDDVSLEFNKIEFAQDFSIQQNLSKLLADKGYTCVPKPICTSTLNRKNHFWILVTVKVEAVHLSPLVIMSSFVKLSIFCSSRTTTPNYYNENTP